jgi:hypothetical protein
MEPTRQHWRVRDTIFAAWRELPGEFTPQEIWRMRQWRTFVLAQPIESGEAGGSPSDEVLEPISPTNAS